MKNNQPAFWELMQALDINGIYFREEGFRSFPVPGQGTYLHTEMKLSGNYALAETCLPLDIV